MKPLLLWAASILAGGVLLLACGAMGPSREERMVGNVPCPMGRLKTGGKYPGSWESCRYNPTSSQVQIDGPYQAWANDGTLRTEGEYIDVMAGAKGKWVFFAPSGDKELSCDFKDRNVACTEFVQGALGKTIDSRDKLYVGGLPDLLRWRALQQASVSLLAPDGTVLSRRILGPDGKAVLIECSPDRLPGFHFYRDDRQAPFNIEAYCMRPPTVACIHDSCGPGFGGHCEGTDCVDDDKSYDGPYKNWSKSGRLIEEGTYERGKVVGGWTKYFGDGQEVTTSLGGDKKEVKRLDNSGRVIWEATYYGKKLSAASRSNVHGGMSLVISPTSGGQYPYLCNLVNYAKNFESEGPCTTADPINGDVVRQGTWTETLGGKKRKVNYVDGVTEEELQKTVRHERESNERAMRERKEAEARGECSFDGLEGVECELRLCARIAAKVKVMKPDTSCFAGDPIDGYRADWNQAVRAIDRYLGQLRLRGDTVGFIRTRNRVDSCVTPQWFRSCSN